MNFIVEFLALGAIIILTGLVLRLIIVQKNNQSLQLNAASQKLHTETLQRQLAEDKASFASRESNLHHTIASLQDSLSQSQKSTQSREGELKKQLADTEKSLQDSLTLTTAQLNDEIESHKKVLSQKKSSEVRLGHIAEKLAPFLDEFDFNPENCIFLGQPIDYISFDEEIITVIEIKTGKSQLNAKQRHIRDLIKAKQIAWKEIRIK